MSEDVQTGTAVECAYPYTATMQTMQTDHVKAATMGAWILAVGTVGYMLGTASFAAWMVVAFLALVPPAVMLWLSAPSRSMSDSIRDVLR
jgi:hypothetical protein